MESTPFRVTVVGGTSMDLKARAMTNLRERRCATGKLFSCPGGVARNIAENLSRISIHTSLVTATGTDAAGQEVVSHTALSGVRMGWVVQSDRFPTSSFVGVLDHHGALHSGIMDGGVVELISSDYLGRIEEAFRTASLVVMDSSLPVESMKTVVRFCSLHKVRLVLVPADLTTTSRFRPFLEGAMLLACNRSEAELLTGVDTSTEEGVVQAATTLIEHGPTLALITMGPEGIFFKSRTEDLRLPATPKAEVVDSMGAGDAYVAGFLYGFLKELPLLKALEIGQFTCSLTLDTPHNVHPKLSLDYIHSSIV